VKSSIALLGFPRRRVNSGSSYLKLDSAGNRQKTLAVLFAPVGGATIRAQAARRLNDSPLKPRHDT
jgi:hypothetical protein